jgi:CHAT domain-containing protein/tetratricopeptide (TPR) repeat protein
MTSRIRYALFGVGVTALALTAWAITRMPGLSPPTQIDRHLAFQGELRPFEPRFGRQIAHRAFSRSRGAETAAPVLSSVLVAGRLSALARTWPKDSGHRLAASGLSLLYEGNVDTAVELLREATQLEPQESSYWSNLSGANMVRGRPSDLLSALDAAEVALRLEPGLSAAAFNRALALTALGLHDPAKNAWKAISEGSDESTWRAEAAERSLKFDTLPLATFTAADLTEANHTQRLALARSNITLTRQLFETELIPRVGRVCRQGVPDNCESELRRVIEVARAAAELSPDSWWKASAVQLAAFGVGGRMDHRRAEGLQLSGDAAKLFSKDMVSQAAELFARVSEASGSAVYWNARYYGCVDAYFRGSHSEARQCLRRVEAAVEPLAFLYLRGKVDWLRAQVSLAEGSLALASSEFERAVRFLSEAGDVTQAVAVESLYATLLDQLGAFDEAWALRVKALRTKGLEPRRLHTLYTSAARSCLLQDLPMAATSFQEAAVKNAERWGQPGALVEAHLGQAAIAHRIGDFSTAQRAVLVARQHQSTVTDPRAASRFETEITVAEGEILARTSPAEALKAISRSREAVTSLSLASMRSRIERAAGIALEQTGRAQEAEDAFAAGMSFLEGQTDRLAPSVQMLSREVGWDLQDRLVDLRFKNKGESAAFVTAETARLATFGGSRRAGSQDIPITSEIPAVLPHDTAVVYFVVQDLQTIRWTFSATGKQVTVFEVGRQAVEQMVRRLQRIFGEDDWNAALTEASRPVYDLLLGKNSPVRVGQLLVIVPDGPLHEVPFSAVRQPGTGRLLVEDFPISVAPSLLAFLTASHVAQEKFPNLDRALLIKGRTGAAEGQPSLPALPNAAAEVEKIAAYYSQVKILSDSTATSASFLEEAGRFPVVHFAGHARADRALPSYSRFFMSPSPSNPSGWLLLRDLETTSFPHTALVVLGACETGAGRIVRGEGVISLARPFLANGAAGVVYSLGNVDDSASARLLTGFHASIFAGLEPVIALQRVQRELLTGAGTSADFRTWAAFQYAGGVLRGVQ